MKQTNNQTLRGAIKQTYQMDLLWIYLIYLTNKGR